MGYAAGALLAGAVADGLGFGGLQVSGGPYPVSAAAISSNAWT